MPDDRKTISRRTNNYMRSPDYSKTMAKVGLAVGSLGNLIPTPLTQLVGKASTILSTGLDSVELYNDIYNKDYKSAALNASQIAAGLLPVKGLPKPLKAVSIGSKIATDLADINSQIRKDNNENLEVIGEMVDLNSGSPLRRAFKWGGGGVAQEQLNFNDMKRKNKFAYGGTPISITDPSEAIARGNIAQAKKRYEIESKYAPWYQAAGVVSSLAGSIAGGIANKNMTQNLGTEVTRNFSSGFDYNPSDDTLSDNTSTINPAAFSAGANQFQLPNLNTNMNFTSQNSFVDPNYSGFNYKPNVPTFPTGGTIKRAGIRQRVNMTPEEYAHSQQQLDDSLGGTYDNYHPIESETTKDYYTPYDKVKPSLKFSGRYTTQDLGNGRVAIIGTDPIFNNRNNYQLLYDDVVAQNQGSNLVFDPDLSFGATRQYFANQALANQQRGWGGTIAKGLGYAAKAVPYVQALMPVIESFTNKPKDPYEDYYKPKFSDNLRFDTGGKISDKDKKMLETYNSNGYDYLKKHGANKMPEKKKTTFQYYAESTNPLMAFVKNYATGGNVPIEAEGQEVVEEPNGNMYELQGASHEQGGIDMNVPEGSQIYSKRLKGMDGKTMADRKKFREQHLAKLQRLMELNPNDRMLKKTYEKTVRDFQKQEEEDLAYMNYMHQQQEMAQQQQAMQQQQMAQAMQQSAYGEGMEEGYQQGYGQGENMGYSEGVEEAYEEQPQFAAGGYVNPYENRNPFF